jgi:hypothetical protein
MSEKKTIQINPDLFRFPKTNKTHKKRNHPGEPNKPIKIKSTSKSVSSKTVRNRLLKYIRQQQDANYKRLSETTNQPSTTIPTEPGFESDFENSLKYLSSIAEKTQQSIPSEYKKGHHSTLRQLPHTTESLLYGSTLNSSRLHNNVGVDLPNVFDEVSPVGHTENPLFLRSTVTNVPKFGCLKNGVLPTYRMWKNQTLRTHGGNTGVSYSSQEAPYEKSSFSSNGVSSSKINAIPSNAIPSNAIPSNAIPSMTFRNPDTFIPQNTVLRNSSPVLGRNLPNSSELRSPEFPRIPSATRPEYFTLSTLGGKPYQIAEMEKHHEHRKNTLQQRPKNVFRKLKQKRTLRRTYRVGKSKHYPNVSVLVSNKTLRKQITTKSQLLKQIPMEEVKKTLIKKGFIKVGSTAPSDVLRKMYETVSLVCGEVQNHNSENLLYNYLHGGDT